MMTRHQHATGVIVHLRRVALALFLGVLALLDVLVMPSFFGRADVPLSMKAALAGFGLWTAVRPTQAVLALVGTLPVAAAMTKLVRTSVSATSVAEVFVLTFLLGVIARGVVLGGRGVPVERSIAIPTLCFGVTVAASAAVSVAPVAHAQSTTVLALFCDRLLRYGDGVAGLRPLWEAAPLLEGVGLLATLAALCRLSTTLAASLTRMIVVGAAAAAALNVNRLVEVVFRAGEGLTSLPNFADQFRINVHYADVNAAGAYFLMTLAIAAALTFATRGWLQKLAWAIATLSIAVALWLTGSRTALFSAPLVGVVFGFGAAFRSWYAHRRIPVLKIATLAVAVGVVAVIFVRHPRMALITHPVHVGGYYERLRLAEASFRMLRTHPLFGIGIGEFYPNSVRFTIPKPPAPENAHNNYLQILAELGLIGFGTFLWTLIVPLRRTWLSLRGVNGDTELVGVTLGVTAFLVVSLAMHPLLVREVAYQFWIALGVLLGLASRTPQAEEPAKARAPVGGMRSHPWLIILVVSAGAIAGTVPFRMQRAILHADLEGRSAGFSPHWETWEDGRRYRHAGVMSTFFVRGEATSVVFPLRANPLHGPVDVEILLDGAVANVVSVPTDRWQEVRLVLPPRTSAPRSRRIDLRVTITSGLNAGDMPLLVGRPALTDPAR